MKTTLPERFCDNKANMTRMKTRTDGLFARIRQSRKVRRQTMTQEMKVKHYGKNGIPFTSWNKSESAIHKCLNHSINKTRSRPKV